MSVSSNPYPNIASLIFRKILSRDKKAQDNAPKVIQEDVKSTSPRGSRSYSTSTRRRAQALISQESTNLQAYGEGQGHMFGLPELPLPSKLHIKHRYDPIIEQVTNLIMRSGKLSQAQRVRPSVLP